MKEQCCLILRNVFLCETHVYTTTTQHLWLLVIYLHASCHQSLEEFPLVQNVTVVQTRGNSNKLNSLPQISLTHKFRTCFICRKIPDQFAKLISWGSCRVRGGHANGSPARDAVTACKSPQNTSWCFDWVSVGTITSLTASRKKRKLWNLEIQLKSDRIFFKCCFLSDARVFDNHFSSVAF